MSDTGTEVPARITLFGFEPTPAEARVVHRPRRWRLTRGLLWWLGCWVIAPIVVFVPPHVPWVLAAFLAGPILGYRRFTEHYTLLEMKGTCPNCGEPLKVEKPTRFAVPYSVHCDHCHNDLQLHADLDAVTPSEARAAH